MHQLVVVPLSLSVVPGLKIKFELFSLGDQFLYDLLKALFNVLALGISQPHYFRFNMFDIRLVVFINSFGVNQQLLKVKNVLAHNCCHIVQLSQLVSIVVLVHAAGAD